VTPSFDCPRGLDKAEKLTPLFLPDPEFCLLFWSRFLQPGEETVKKKCVAVNQPQTPKPKTQTLNPKP